MIQCATMDLEWEGVNLKNYKDFFCKKFILPCYGMMQFNFCITLLKNFFSYDLSVCI